MNTRTRLTTAQEASLVALDKNIRATRYPNPKEQREFLDKQASTVVNSLNILYLSRHP